MRATEMATDTTGQFMRHKQSGRLIHEEPTVDNIYIVTVFVIFDEQRLPRTRLFRDINQPLQTLHNVL